jgi:hypothetical protein
MALYRMERHQFVEVSVKKCGDAEAWFDQPPKGQGTAQKGARASPR